MLKSTVYKIGDAVMAIWPQDGIWYEAEIIRVNKCTYTVKYTVDNIKMKLLAHQIKPKNITPTITTAPSPVISNIFTDTTPSSTASDMETDTIKDTWLPVDSPPALPSVIRDICTGKAQSLTDIDIVTNAASTINDTLNDTPLSAELPAPLSVTDDTFTDTAPSSTISKISVDNVGLFDLPVLELNELTPSSNYNKRDDVVWTTEHTTPKNTAQLKEQTHNFLQYPSLTDTDIVTNAASAINDTLNDTPLSAELPAPLSVTDDTFTDTAPSSTISKISVDNVGLFDLPVLELNELTPSSNYNKRDDVVWTAEHTTPKNTVQLKEQTYNILQCPSPDTSFANDYEDISVPAHMSTQVNRPDLRPRLDKEIASLDNTVITSSSSYANDVCDNSDDIDFSSGSDYDPNDDENVVSDSDNSVKSLLVPMSNFRSQSPIIHQNKTIAQTPSSTTGCDSACINTITVMTTNNDGNVRKWDKKHYCYFCSEGQSKLPRHLMSKHSDEPEVVKVKAETNLETRSNMLCKLRNLGNHKHNCDVIRKNSGQLIVGYRPSKQSVNPNDYGPCSYCYGYYVRQDLWKHRCPLKPQKRKNNQDDADCECPRIRERMASKSILLKPAPCGVLAPLNQILAPMKSDEISRIVQSDDLILEVAKREFMKAGHDEDQHNYIRSKLRELGRLLWQLRKNTLKPNACLQSFIDPEKFSTLIKSVHDLAGFDFDSHDFKIPSLALKLGHTIKKCALIVKANALEKNDKDMAEIADNFYKLCEMKWEIEISTHAHRTLYQAKRNNPDVLPSSTDVVILSQYLDTTGDDQKARLNNSSENKDIKMSWDLLNEITLCQIILFNRRRQGEVSKMKTADFHKKQITKVGDTIHLSEIEKHLCKIFEVVEVVGKRGGTVPVLLTTQMTERISHLLDKRSELEIPAENKFLFPRSSYQSFGHIRGSDAMRKHALLAEVKNPETMRSTKLRKQVATVAQMLALKENQIELLANYMGHDVRVHREYYQLPDNVLRVTKLSRLFIAMEQGTLQKYQGRSLDELEIDNTGGIEELDIISSDEESDVEIPQNKASTSQANTKAKKPEISENGTIAKTSKFTRKKTVWSEDEIIAIYSLKNILHLRIPGKKDIEEVQKRHPVLKRRS
ncbi:hypothetical protein SNE40_021963 [Patella caerulea]